MKHVSEIFGFPPTNKEKETEVFREKFRCPFTGNECDTINKKSNLTDTKGRPLLTHQTGACSVFYNFKNIGTKPAIICPYRFLERDDNDRIIIFDFIKNEFFGGNELLLVREVGLKSYGRADWIICEAENKRWDTLKSLNIKDYAHLELQSDATTGTRDLVICVKHFFEDKDITKKKYNYGLNSKASIKGSSLQMIDKGYLFRGLNKKSFWVMQDTLFNILCSIYNVKMNKVGKGGKIDTTDNLIFIVVSLGKDGKSDKFKINIKGGFSTSPDKLQKAMSSKEIIDEKVLLENVKKKIRSGNYIKC